MSYYFSRFEDKKPPPPLELSVTHQLVWQFLAVVNLVLGGWYIAFRWTSTINFDALWFSLPLVCAESCAYIGLVLFTINLWKVEDTPRGEPPRLMSECVGEDDEMYHRPIKVDVFFPTYNEDPELVRLSIADAKNLTYPHPIDLEIAVLDDGRRPEMKEVADEEGVKYFCRDNNIGFKAGNLRHGMERTSGDFLLICDADTRPFPTMLQNTLGYFRDPAVAWVQTPQWFFDLPEGMPLSVAGQRLLGAPGRWLGRLLERCLGPIRIAEDPFNNDPKMFYDVIQRRRNWANASFCCGAGSVHRREAVMHTALKSYADQISILSDRIMKAVGNVAPHIEKEIADEVIHRLALKTEFTPYKFHVSEDIFTSVMLHCDSEKRWKSVFHPQVESKMLSPQDLLSWTVQRFKYAGGSLDIMIHDKLFWKKGLSVTQRLMYGATFWSYLAGLWNVVFVLAPMIFLFTGISPVASMNSQFFAHLIPFLIANEVAFMVGTWGLSQWDGRASYLSFFPVNLKAIWTVVRGKTIKFTVTPKLRQDGSHWRLVFPQILVLILTVVGIVYGWVQVAMGRVEDQIGVFANSFWGLVTISCMAQLVLAAFWKPSWEDWDDIQG